MKFEYLIKSFTNEIDFRAINKRHRLQRDKQSAEWIKEDLLRAVVFKQQIVFVRLANTVEHIAKARAARLLHA
ncbi:hypothetical protein EIMP300_50060 [Escherichia coli]|uniref:Uncharacterized protein n=1 Tax=Escherichia coli TaxID=562 RepID=A0A8S0FTB7_ECOLX|nr:hypothetical protein EIMP300_50060 [Escherichia coli]